MRLTHLKQAGDTIVEVLISMAAVSMVLGAAFVTINQSVSTGRTAQERVEALKQVESQIEILKKYTRIKDPVDPLWSKGTFCYDIDGSNTITRNDFSGTVNDSIDLDDFNPGVTYPSKCIQGFYHISIKHIQGSGSDASAQIFNVRARWESASGHGRNEVGILYRIYPGQ